MYEGLTPLATRETSGPVAISRGLAPTRGTNVRIPIVLRTDRLGTPPAEAASKITGSNKERGSAQAVPKRSSTVLGRRHCSWDDCDNNKGLGKDLMFGA